MTSDFSAMKKAHLNASKIWGEGSLDMKERYISFVRLKLKVVRSGSVDKAGSCREEWDDFVELNDLFGSKIHFKFGLHERDLNNQLLFNLGLNSRCYLSDNKYKINIVNGKMEWTHKMLIH